MSATVSASHAAILFADVKGYSVLISRDEVGTYDRLLRARALFRQLVDDYHGRIVDEAGDGVLATFPCTAHAVDFALAVQRDMASAAAWQGESGPFAFRIGIHTGPVHLDGDRPFGHSLIVAQRIQEIAAPGRVFISHAARTELGGRTDLRFTSMGLRALKNIDPIQIHRVADRNVTEALDPLHVAPDTAGYTDEATIAVLPLESHSRLPADQAVSDGVTDDIIERLSRFRDLCVISRHSTFRCRALAHAPAEIGQLLGVRYVALGSMRRGGDRLRIVMQLLEAETGRLVWSDRFDGSVADVFDFQDEVADTIAARLASQVSTAERRRILSSRAPQVGAYGLVLRGQDLMIRYQREANTHARHLFEEAAQLDPEYGRVYSGLSRTFSVAWRYRWAPEPDGSLERATLLAQQAIERDEQDSRGFAELGYAYLYQKRHREALESYERALLLNPNDADVLALMTDALTCVGELDRAVASIQRAMRLNPCYPDWYLWNYAETLFDLERYGDVIGTLSKMRDLTEGHRLLAASHALLGQVDEARHHADAVRRVHPEFSLKEWLQVPPNVESASQQKYFEGLRIAGLD